MHFLARPHLLVWRQDHWQSYYCKDYFQSNTKLNQGDVLPAADTPIDDALKQLAVLLRQNAVKPVAVLLPDCWVESDQFELDAELPESLYLMAAHTQASNVTRHATQQHTLSYIVTSECKHSPSMYVAVLLKKYHDTFLQLGIHQVFSERVIRLSNARSWRAIRSVSRPFLSYQKDYLERRAERKERIVLAACIALVALSGIGGGLVIRNLTPEFVETFKWPWPSIGHHQDHVLGSLTQLRTLPVSVRLDEASVTKDKVHLIITGNTHDFQTWHKNWPDRLPPLEVTTSKEAL
ncbi:hypothetical protein [Marinomonas atlantica]|uniref:hypothetical protein n=1 Tax=Marinomonas atlantica TaxID=1806668 RepID=UPI0008377CF8|nr:hypothetical protein [Marinomonas atlantica]MCO4784380.1 hypothetical protein [Marinomonas atlantica]